MKKFYAKETRNEASEFYRRGDWGVEKPDDWDNGKDNFTDVAPPAQCLKDVDPIPCDWNGTVWIVDTVAEDHINAVETLNSTDIPLTRVLEDLVATLIAKGTITMEDLPQAAQDKLSARTAARGDL